ncbi:hypothetical protein [Micromonospora inositola]|uniref:Uncharacterized protein n=1 Tax=Micromonospora inositola TaxID=47865 RepID=A0A1C5I8Z3_9ACTN|nr:hypothetical protein [Micromonospora inositola]SCG54737.1 hypothetical protein GA0070613_2459 [Micromonospora inositola]
MRLARPQALVDLNRSCLGGADTGGVQPEVTRIQVGKVHARKLVSVALDEHTITVYDADSPITAVPRRSTTDLNRVKAKHQITTTAG